MTAHVPRKRFGQHFLHDKNVITKILGIVSDKKPDIIVEIGPGEGALTFPLLQSGNSVEVIEIDRDLVTALQEKKNQFSKLSIHQCDVLHFDFSQYDMNTLIVGNLPYNISTPILFHLVNFSNCYSALVFMLQKEVVDRICAQPGNKQYGRLSVMLQSRFTVKSLFDIKPGAFHPPPKVTSSIVELVPDTSLSNRILNHTVFENVVRQAFSQRRKKINNALSSLLNEGELLQAGIDSSLRAEDINIDQYISLANTLAANP